VNTLCEDIVCREEFNDSPDFSLLSDKADCHAGMRDSNMNDILAF
jgi:hypothetical protein